MMFWSLLGLPIRVVCEHMDPWPPALHAADPGAHRLNVFDAGKHTWTFPCRTLTE